MVQSGSMRRSVRLAWPCPMLSLLALALSLLACSDDTGRGAADPEQALARRDQGVAPGTVSCRPDHSDCRDFVVSRLLLPVNTADAQRYGLKLAGGETVNALGAILTALASISPATTVQDTVDDAVYQGSTIVLARLQASDFQSDPATAGQTWVGQKVSCCPTAGGNKQTCKEEALGSCFGGSHPFAVDGSAAQSSLLSGQLSGGKLSMTASMLRINLPLTSAGVMELTLRSVQLRGTLSEGGLREGALAGTITRSEVDQKLLPSMAQMLDAMIKDAATAPEMKDFLGTVFDRDKDGGITVTEVRESSIRSLLTGDVDTDRDGEKELSLGIGFEGVSAVIQGK